METSTITVQRITSRQFHNGHIVFFILDEKAQHYQYMHSVSNPIVINELFTTLSLVAEGDTLEVKFINKESAKSYWDFPVEKKRLLNAVRFTQLNEKLT